MVINNIPEIFFVKEMYQYGFNNTEARRLNNRVIGYILGKVNLIELSIHNSAEYLKKKFLSFIEVYLTGWLKIRKKAYV
jgi:hypothetical protein